MRDEFRSAIFPSQHHCLGLALEQLTLRHLFLLEQSGSPFRNSSSMVHIGDLAIAVFICCQKASKSERDMKRWWFKLWMKLWPWLCRKMTLTDELAKFEAYLKTAHASVTVKIPEKGRTLGAPWELRMLASLISEFHLSLDEALDFPMAFAQAMIVAKDEEAGHVNLLTEEEDSFWNLCKKRDQEKASAKN